MMSLWKYFASGERNGEVENGLEQPPTHLLTHGVHDQFVRFSSPNHSYPQKCGVLRRHAVLKYKSKMLKGDGVPPKYS